MTEEDQRKQQFISPSKHKLNPYLVIHFNRTENFGAGGGGGGGGGGGEESLSSNCSCSWFATFMNFPLINSNRNNWETDTSLSAYVRAKVDSILTIDEPNTRTFSFISFGLFASGTMTASGSVFGPAAPGSPFSSVTVESRTGVYMDLEYMSFGDPCYLRCGFGNPSYNSRFDVGLTGNFTIEVDVYYGTPLTYFQQPTLRVGNVVDIVKLNITGSAQALVTHNKIVATIAGQYTISSNSITTSQWYSIAICRQSATWKLVVNNAVVGTQVYPLPPGQFNTHGFSVGGGMNEGSVAVFSNARMNFRQCLY